MSGIALFAPDDETCHQAEDFLKTAKDSHISIFKRSQTEDILVEAQKAISEGVTIIIARGRQAEIIKKNTNVTVADIVLTAQELGLLILKPRISSASISAGFASDCSDGGKCSAIPPILNSCMT